MFKAEISDARLFKNILSAVSALVDEVNFNLTPNGIKLRSMDPSHVAMIDLELPNEIFKEYKCPKPITIRISLDGFLKLLKRAKNNETVKMTYNEEKRKIECAVTNDVKKLFKIPTLEALDEETPTPKITFKSKIKMTSNAFKEIIEDAQSISDSVSLETSSNQLIVVAEDELSSARFEMDENSSAILEMSVDEASKASFNLMYLTDMVKAGTGISEIIILEFSKDMPLKLYFPLPQSGILSYFLAPRIEAE